LCSWPIRQRSNPVHGVSLWSIQVLGGWQNRHTWHPCRLLLLPRGFHHLASHLSQLWLIPLHCRQFCVGLQSVPARLLPVLELLCKLSRQHVQEPTR
jgi:hypothetical protein